MKKKKDLFEGDRPEVIELYCVDPTKKLSKRKIKKAYKLFKKLGYVDSSTMFFRYPDEFAEIFGEAVQRITDSFGDEDDLDPSEDISRKA